VIECDSVVVDIAKAMGNGQLTRTACNVVSSATYSNGLLPSIAHAKYSSRTAGIPSASLSPSSPYNADVSGSRALTLPAAEKGQSYAMMFSEEASGLTPTALVSEFLVV